MRRAILLVVAVVILAGVATAAAYAQVPADPEPVAPTLCYVAEYDLNGDGKVNRFDMNHWKDLLFQSGGKCELGAPAGECPAGMDINEDGIITFDDLEIMLQHLKYCLRTPRPFIVPR